MAYSTNKTKQAMIAKVHIAKGQLNMTDDDYRALLERITGKTSAAKLTVSQLEKVINEMQRLGFVPKKAQKQDRKPNVINNRKALISKISAQLAEAGRTWTYADAIAKRMFNIEKVEWLDADQLWRLAAALGYDADRHGRPV